MTTPLQAVLGYLELGMIAEANAEIENLPPQEKSRTDVLEMRLEIYRQAGSWSLMEVVARELLRTMPDNPDPWSHLAFAVRRNESLNVARELLETAEAMFPVDATIQFNLGCYACQMGDIKEAKKRVEKATSLDRKFQMLALDDPDLEPMWETFKV
jgi:Tfp pilus assembly protein PilF